MAKNLLKTALSTLFALLFYTFVSYMAYFGVYTYITTDARFAGVDVYPHTVCLAVITCFSLYSFLRYAAIKDGIQITRFQSSGADTTLKSRLVFLLKSPVFYASFALFTAVFLLLPDDALCGCSVKAIYPVNPPQNALSTVKLLTLALAFVLNLLANLSASGFWAYRADDIASGKLTRKKIAKDANGHSFIALLAYLAGSWALILAVQAVTSLSPLFAWLFTPAPLIVIALLIIFIPATARIRAVKKRKAFVKELKALCAENGFTLSEIKDPVRSLFKFTSGESFCVNNGETDYRCKLIHGVRKGVPMVFGENGVGAYLHMVYIMRMKAGSYSTAFKFGFEADGKKILIINPVPNELMGLSGGKHYPIDNGDTVGGYKIYSASAFLGALERKCL